jgi:hypothetical protein
MTSDSLIGANMAENETKWPIKPNAFVGPPVAEPPYVPYVL